MSSNHCGWIIITNNEHDFKHEILARPIFPHIETLIYVLICFKNDFYPATIKNDNGFAAMRKFFVRHERKQQLHQFKNEKIG